MFMSFCCKRPKSGEHHIAREGSLVMKILGNKAILLLTPSVAAVRLDT